MCNSMSLQIDIQTGSNARKICYNNDSTEMSSSSSSQ